MATWQDARDKIRRDLWRPSASALPDETCDEAILAACHLIESERRWLWLETMRLSDPLTSSVANLPLDCGHIRSVTLVWPDQAKRTMLQQETLGRIQHLRLQTPGAIGHPRCYARTDQDILLDVEPHPGSRIEIVYIAETPSTIAEARAVAVNLTIYRAFNAVCAGAAAAIARTYLKDEEEAQRQTLALAQAMETLIRKDDDERDHGEVRQVNSEDWWFHALGNSGW